jgi:hypothetical protein
MTDLSTKIRHTLTETRMVLPGTQALLGFQLIVLLMEGFEKLPRSSKIVHLASLAFTAVTAIWLIAPAAYHRIAYEGEDSERFLALASRFLLAAMVTLALSVTGDYFVIARQATGSAALSAGAAGFLLLLFYGCWFAIPLLTRRLKT